MNTEIFHFAGWGSRKKYRTEKYSLRGASKKKYEINNNLKKKIGDKLIELGINIRLTNWWRLIKVLEVI